MKIEDLKAERTSNLSYKPFNLLTQANISNAI